MYYEENNIIPKKEYNNIIDTLHKEKKNLKEKQKEKNNVYTRKN